MVTRAAQSSLQKKKNGHNHMAFKKNIVTALKKKKKIPAGLHLSATLSLPLLCSAPRRTRRPAAGHPRLPCHVPAILASRANPSLLSSPQDPAPAPFPSNPNLIRSPSTIDAAARAPSPP